MTNLGLLPAQRLIQQFLEVLRELPDIDGEIAFQAVLSGSYDAQIDLRVADKSFVLLIEAKKTIYPRDAHQILWRFSQAKRSEPKISPIDSPQVPVLVAELISPGAKELLQQQRFGYYDSGGSLYLPAPGAYFYVDKPPPKTFAKSMGALFSGRRAQVLHALLVHYQQWFGGTELAQLAQVSTATVSQVLSELERLDWLMSRGQGPSKERHLREPAALLDAWAKQLAASRPLHLRRYYVPAAKGDALMARVANAFDTHDAGYTISHEAAAQRYAPFLSAISQVRVRLVLGSSAEAAIADLDARVVSEGANLAIIEAKSPGELLFRERVGGTWLASPIQVYLDLLRGEGRSKEMAEHLRKEKIGF